MWQAMLRKKDLFNSLAFFLAKITAKCKKELLDPFGTSHSIMAVILMEARNDRV